MILDTNIDPCFFDEFVKKNPLNHYMKTSMWASLQASESRPYYCGFYENDQLVATALLLKRKWLNTSYFYLPWGPCIDIENIDQFTNCLDLLKRFTKKENCFMLRIDFNILRCYRDIDGNQLDGCDNEQITNTLVNCGFKHKGYGYAYNGSFVNRYTLIKKINIDATELLKSFSKPRQTAIKRHNLLGVTTSIGTIDDISHLMEFEKELTKTQGFKPHSKKFFEHFFTSFKQNARLYVTRCNLKQMVQALDDEIHSKKYAKDKEALASKQKELLEAINLQKQYGDSVVVACGLFIYFGSKSWDLYTYNKKAFAFVKPVDNLHYFAMQDLSELGVEDYDMCGFSGSVDKKDPYYGLYSYKKSFGSEFTEFIGEFDFIENQKNYNQFIKQYRLISKIKRKINTKIYLKK